MSSAAGSDPGTETLSLGIVGFDIIQPVL